MEKAIALFEKNLQRVKGLVRVAKQMETENNQVSQDILRSAIVLLVSACDTFVHDVVRMGMMQILKGESGLPKISGGNACCFI